MKIKVYIEREDKDVDLEVDSIKDIFEKLNINQETVIITRNNELITDKAKLNNNDKIKLLSVISGG